MEPLLVRIDNRAQPKHEVQECKHSDHSPEVGVFKPLWDELHLSLRLVNWVVRLLRRVFWILIFDGLTVIKKKVAKLLFDVSLTSFKKKVKLHSYVKETTLMKFDLTQKTKKNRPKAVVNCEFVYLWFVILFQ